MSTLVRPQLAHPIAEDLDELALQLLSLGWVLRAPATTHAADTASQSRTQTLLVYADPFGPPIAQVRLLAHHQIQLRTEPGRQVLVDDVEDLHHRLHQQIRHHGAVAAAEPGSRSS